MRRKLPGLLFKKVPGIRVILALLLALITDIPLVYADDPINLFQEEKVVTGTITDAATGEALPGVSVMIRGTTKGTITNIEGKYSISVSAGDVLLYSYVGYLEEEFEVSDHQVIDIQLVTDIVGLEEVRVIGYGVQKKKLVTGSTTQVKSEDLAKSHATRLESSLQGLTPGMVIVKESGQPGSDFNITIRGLGSVNGSTPLVLIDGVPGDLNNLNPSDIETVDVLKDAASAAIYGSRAADGVILVTTKKGEAGEPQLVYDFYYGWANPAKKLDLLNAKEYAMIMNEANANIFPNRDPLYTDEFIATLDEGTDWQEEAYHRNAPTQSHYMGLTGGTTKSAYSFSVSYLKESGIFDYNDKSNYERIGFRLNSDHKPTDYIRVGQNLTYTHRQTRGLSVGGYNNNFLRSILSANPIMEAYDPDIYDGFGRWTYIEEQVNPIASMHYNNNEIKRYDDVVGNVYAELEFIKGLKIRTDFGGTINFQNNSTATDSFQLTSLVENEVPDYRHYMERKFGYNWDNLVSYETNIGDHQILAMVGMNRQDNWFFNMDIDANAFLENPNLAEVPSNVVLRPDVVGDTVIIKADKGFGVSRSSIFTRLSYNYREMILGTVSFRNDGSSRFGRNYRYGNFFAVSLGYVLTESSLLNSSTWLNFLKLRGSWGQNGKEPDQEGRFLATVGSDARNYSFGIGQLTGVSPNIMPNPNLKWESMNQLDIGFDSRFLKNFSLTFDWYYENAEDWIVPVSVPAISGIAGISATNPYINGGNVINTGVELELGYVKNIGDLFLSLSGNIAYNKNKVTEVPGEIINGSTSILYNGSAEFYRVQEGYPIGFFYGYRTDGLFQDSAEVSAWVNEDGERLQPNAVPGDVRRLDLNNDGLIDDDDKTMIGNPNPDIIYGINASVAYKGWSFSMLISGQAGNQIVKSYRQEERAYPNYTTDILDRWTATGSSERIPRVTGGLDRNQNWRFFSDLYVEDAGYMKIKSISIGYDFKKLWNGMPLKQFQLYVSATNLLTITNYTGLDPEVGYGSYYDSDGLLQDPYASGIDVGFYPAARTYLAGLNVKF